MWVWATKAPLCAGATLLLQVGALESSPQLVPAHNVFHQAVRGLYWHGAHWQLWRHIFSPRLTTGRGGQSFVGCFSIQLCSTLQSAYLKVPLSSSVRGYEGVWFWCLAPNGTMVWIQIETEGGLYARGDRHAEGVGTHRCTTDPHVYATSDSTAQGPPEPDVGVRQPKGS